MHPLPPRERSQEAPLGRARTALTRHRGVLTGKPLLFPRREATDSASRRV